MLHEENKRNRKWGGKGQNTLVCVCYCLNVSKCIILSHRLYGCTCVCVCVCGPGNSYSSSNVTTILCGVLEGTTYRYPDGHHITANTCSHVIHKYTQWRAETSEGPGRSWSIGPAGSNSLRCRRPDPDSLVVSSLPAEECWKALCVCACVCESQSERTRASQKHML